MDNSAEIFALALGLQEPWYIEKIDFNKSNSQLDIHINFKKGSKFLMEDGNKYSAYDTVERKWQHLNFFQHRCYLHGRVPKDLFRNKVTEL